MTCNDTSRALRQVAARAFISSVVLVLGASGHASSPPQPEVAAQTAHVRSSEVACARLSGRTVAGTSLTTTVVPASGDAPKYCKVSGTIAPALNFELRLPNVWNGKLYYAGGGGYDGALPGLILPPLTQGYAEVVSDSGHQGDGMSADFALNDPFSAQLFGSLSVPTVTAEAKKILFAAYGTAPDRSYFEGCSTGGREALMAVQRDPFLFDGAIARAPAYNWVGLMGQFNRTAKALAASGGEFSTAKLILLAKRVRDACDALDGVVDGVVSNPSACTAAVINIDSLRCPNGADAGDSCLSDAQLAVIQAWTSDAVFSGSSSYRSRGYNLTGNEDDPVNFGLWVSGKGDLKTAGQYIIQDTTVKYYLARDPEANSLTYAWDQNQTALYALAALNDATQTDIRPFLGNGGKLIVWHGGADAALSVNATIEYVENVRKAVGDSKAAASMRLYVAPGVNHCGGGPGADTTDLLSALDRWVTKGMAPETLVGQKLDAHGVVSRKMPLCEYPQYPRYVGSDHSPDAIKHAENYRCVSP